MIVRDGGHGPASTRLAVSTARCGASSEAPAFPAGSDAQVRAPERPAGAGRLAQGRRCRKHPAPGGDRIQRAAKAGSMPATTMTATSRASHATDIRLCFDFKIIVFSSSTGFPLDGGNLAMLPRQVPIPFSAALHKILLWKRTSGGPGRRRLPRHAAPCATARPRSPRPRRHRHRRPDHPPRTGRSTRSLPPPPNNRRHPCQRTTHAAAWLDGRGAAGQRRAEALPVLSEASGG